MDKILSRLRSLGPDNSGFRRIGNQAADDFAPEFLFDCEVCNGAGYTARTIHVYEAGCGFSHPDVEELPCEACGGNGWFIGEAEGNIK